jgi:hypothetical protein
MDETFEQLAAMIQKVGKQAGFSNYLIRATQDSFYQQADSMYQATEKEGMVINYLKNAMNKTAILEEMRELAFELES